MSFVAPSPKELGTMASSLGLSLSESDLAAIAELSAELAETYDRIEALGPGESPRYPRGPGHAPVSNPHNAWAWICEIKGAPQGPLHGVRVGIKDNISIAGLPMCNGSRVLDGFEPDMDATVVTRVLDAGATIVGKTVCEDLCFSGGSHTSTPDPVRNPYDATRSAGGSSSGNALAIAAGDVVMCIGSDQGGSVRTPASWSGVVGLKATHGLVPYTGAYPLEPAIDHLGPMGRTVMDVARLLAVIAGPDGLDPRQMAAPPVQDYVAATERPLADLRIGILREGFGRPESEAATDATVRNAIARMVRAGAKAEEVSIPWHIDGYKIAAPFLMEGSLRFLFEIDAGSPVSKSFTASVPNGSWSRLWRERAEHLPDIAKFVLLFGLHSQDRYQWSHYRRAQILRHRLKAAYDCALERFDVLALPTTPFTATPLPAPDAGFAERVRAGLDMEGNTAPFNISGHPAISVPCGFANGLPVGLMFVGPYGGETKILRAAAGFERLGDWKTL